MRVRTKDCFKCNEPKEVLYRCRYEELQDWVFLCGKCLTDVKSRFEDTYQYGGTWKSKKKQRPSETHEELLIYKCNRDTLMNSDSQITNEEDENPFKDMGFIKFWIVSTVFWFSFPVSLVLCYLALGSVKTKQLVKALVHDFLQTLFIIFVVICVIVYGIYHYVSGMF